MAITFNETTRIFTLTTAHTTYQMQADAQGYLLHLYYGARTAGEMDYLLNYGDRGFSGNPNSAGSDRTYSLDALTQENPSLGTGDFRNYALNIENADGSQFFDNDVCLVDGELYVALKENEINKARKLRNLYLNPIREQFEMNGGSGYPNGKSFQLLIDLKTDYKETMKVLEQQLLEYRDCFDVKKNPLAVRVVVSGFLPSPEEFSNYADFIFFDGRPRFIYTPEQSLRIPMMSTSFRTLTQWNGLGRMVETDYNKVKAFIDKAVREKKKDPFSRTAAF